MIMRYSIVARMAMQQVRDLSENEFHSLRGLVILLSTAPVADDKDKIEMDLGSEMLKLVYMGLDWWIAYEIEDEGETLHVFYIDEP